MTHLTIGRAALAVLATTVVCLSQAAVASAGGNSANAKLCQMGGWQNLVRSDGSGFANEGDCVSYAAHGGTLTQESQAQIDCQSFGGTYAPGTAPSLWTCDGWLATSDSDLGTKFQTLFGDCKASGGTGIGAFGVPFPTTNTFFSCFIPE